MKDKTDYRLKAHNTFGIDAKCSRFVEFANEKEAVEVADILCNSVTPYLIIGRGSNLLLTRDFEGVVVRSAVNGIQLLDNDNSRQKNDVLVRCGSGERWDDFVGWTITHGLYGAENLSLIPGDVGASAVQNIGAYGAEVKDIIVSVEAVEIASGKLCVLTNSDCQYGYRDSRFKHEWNDRFLITHVTYRLNHLFHPHLEYGNIRSELERRNLNEPTARQLRDLIIDIRREKLPDPEQTGNAGSFFMNPVVSHEKYEQLIVQYPNMPHYYVDNHHEKIPAGWLIDQCGWKGRSLGRAGVYSHQALVLVNLGGATGEDIFRLYQAIQHDVRQKFGIELRPEVNIKP